MSAVTSHIILQTKDISIGYEHKKKSSVVHSDINLSIAKGSFVAILGRNGIGKSTLLRTITKVQHQLEGTIELDQKDLQQHTSQELAKKISLVLTERLPESQLTVYELVALGRQPYTNWVGKLTEEDHERVRSALEKTDTLDFAQKHFYELSDGQLQRVMIARAIAQDTDIIVLDEPTAHLDMHHTIKIFQLLEKLVKETHKTIIVSSHEVNLAIKSVDQIVLMTETEVVSGSVQELIKENTFDRLFPSEILNFDKTLEQFVIRKNG